MLIHGHEIDLNTPEAGHIVTDVIVLARTLRHNDDGRLSDFILISTTDTTTGMIQRGMIHEALDSFADPE